MVKKCVKKSQKYDIVIVGMGPSSVFCAYELLKLNCNKKILLIEKGKRIEDRECPIEKTGKCLKCKPICSIIGGFSGAGAFSDGKLLSYHLSSFNENTDDIYIGGKDDSFLKSVFSADEIKKYIKYTDDIYLSFGASKDISGIEYFDKIKKFQHEAEENDLCLVDVPIRHLGTEKSHELYYKIEKYLEGKVDMIFETEVLDLIIDDNAIYGVKTNNGDIYGDKVILGVGFDGSEWLEKKAREYNIETRNGYMDIGIRYELSDDVMKTINKYMYEGKFIGHLAPYHDKVRTYCQNPSGYVTAETYDNGISLVNGHSYKDKKSNNTNLAILVSYKFSDPFKSPVEYGFNIGKKANMITGGTVVVQRYGDLINYEATTREKLENNFVVPTMKSAFPFDLSYVLDYRTIVNLKQFIEGVNKVIPGFNNEDNLLYGPEVKFYGNELVLNDNFETSVKNLYSIGCGGGLTIGLMMASVSGVMMARILENKRFGGFDEKVYRKRKIN